MSKKSKLKNREKRLMQKRARKAANKLRYAELKRQGINGKSKRFTKSLKRKLAKVVDHKTGHCGNIACKKCYPEMHSPSM